MAVARDQTSQFNITGDGNQDHTPIGTPKGVAVLISENVHTADVIAGVTYGGTAMTRKFFIARTAGDEDVAVYGYFLGASIPTGTQNVAVDVSSGTTAKTVYVITYTAAADTEVPDTYVGTDSNGTGSPTFTIPTAAGFAGSVATCCTAGLANCSNVTIPSGYNNLGTCRDYTSQVTKAADEDGLSGADIVVAWTTNADDTAAGGMAIQEASGPTTVQGASSLTITFDRITSGVREVVGSALTPIVFGITTTAAGAQTVAGASSLTLTFAATTSGVREVTGATSLPLTFGVTTSGRREVTGAATLPIVFGITTSARRIVLGSNVVPIVFGITTTPSGAIRGATSLEITFGATTTPGPVTRHGATSLPVTVGAATSGRHTAIGATSLPLTVGVTTNALRIVQGATVTPIVFGITTSGVNPGALVFVTGFFDQPSVNEQDGVIATMNGSQVGGVFFDKPTVEGP